MLLLMCRGKLAMLFMAPAAVKAERLNACPVETNCGSAWHNVLGTTLRDVFLSAQT